MLTSCLRAADVDRLRPSQQAPLLQACASTLFPGCAHFSDGPFSQRICSWKTKQEENANFSKFPWRWAEVAT